MFWPLAASTWGKEEINAARRVLESGNTTMGVNVAKFEAEFAKYHNMRYAIMVNSGSSANLIAVAALCHIGHNALKRGDEVIVPAISWATTYYPLHQHGLKLRIVDVDLETLNIDPMIFQHSPIGNARMIVGVSILGNPAPLDWFADSFQMKERNIILFEDNCESLDALTPSGNRTGTHGLVNTFSFFFTHHISTMEGGMILTNDREMCNLCRSLRNHGWARGIEFGSIADFTSIESGDGFNINEKYQFILPGYNVRPLEIAGAIGLEQLKKLPAMTKQRRKNWALFQHLFATDGRFIIQKEWGQSSAFAFTLICRRREDRADVLGKLRKANIGFRMITGGNILRHPVIKHFDYVAPEDGCPNADKVHYNGFFVGNHPYDLEKQIYKLKEVLV